VSFCSMALTAASFAAPIVRKTYDQLVKVLKGFG
jgi:hypothetical protein